MLLDKAYDRIDAIITTHKAKKVNKNFFKSIPTSDKKQLTFYKTGIELDYMKKTLKQRGRPKGATSNCRVKMKDLMKFITPEGTVVVGKTWLEEIGIGVDEAQITKIKVVKEMAENTVIEQKGLF